jgi:hypothetical protein
MLVASALAWFAAGGPVPAYDFDGDGRQEIAIGLPGYQTAGVPDAGAVVVLHGASYTLLTRDTPGVPGVPYGDDALGSALAGADFDADGYGDLAIAVPGDRAVHVLHGSAAGVTGARTERIALEPSGEDFFDPFYPSLVAGDLDGDGYADLVIGPRKLRLHFGGPTGLSPRPRRVIERPRRFAATFGGVLALGDVNADGRLDLVEGAHGSAEDSDGEAFPGHIVYCRGTATGPRHCRRIMGRRPGPASLAVADVTGDGFDDIVAGIPAIRPNGDDEEVPGAVEVIRGGPQGPGAAVRLHPGLPGIPGARSGADEFGASVAAADLDLDGYADIVVGAPGVQQYRGRITVIRGGPDGYSRHGNASLDEASPGVPGRPSAYRIFGASVSVLGARRVVVGVPAARNGVRGYGALAVLDLRRSLEVRRAQRVTLRTLRLRARAAPETFSPPFGAVLGGLASSSTTGEAFY